MALPKNAADVGMLQETVFFQNRENLKDLQCFGFVWQNIPDYHLSWECSSVSKGFPVNYETHPFPVLPSEPCNGGWQKDHFMDEDTSNSPWSLIQDSGPSSAFIEASPCSETFVQDIQAGSNISQSSDLVGPASGVGSRQQPIDTAEITAKPEQRLPDCALGGEKGLKVSDSSNDLPSEVVRLTTDPPKGGCEKNSRSRASIANGDHQGRKAKIANNKKGSKMIVRERNRLSAAKCRDRKRDLANTLKFKLEELTDLHQELSLCYNEVRSEVMRLKNEILRHADCDCDVIRAYISAEANRIVYNLTGDDSFLDSCDSHRAQGRKRL